MTRPGSFDDEFYRLREYRLGDNTSAIHWRTSARRNELMICEYHQVRDQGLSILLDLWLPNNPADEHRERVELAISFAATVGLEHLQQSRESSLNVAASGRGQSHIRWEGQVGQSLVESLLDWLALVQAGASRHVEDMLNEAKQVQLSSAKLLLITTRKTTDASYQGLRRARTPFSD